MYPLLQRALVASAAASLAACFSPSFGDGEIACGSAGCPPGMYCGVDGFCHTDPDPGPGTPDPGGGGGEIALAVGNDDGAELFAVCDGDLRLVWRASGEARQLAWGDIDGDGYPDLAFANMTGPAMVYGLGATGFEVRWVSPDNAPSRGIALADFDGDGADDVVVAMDDGPIKLYATGGGAPALAWSSGVAARHWELDAGDYDGDGDPDLAVAIKGKADEIYRNDGSLVLAWTSGAVEETEAARWADVDGDGLLELATGGDEAPARIFRNTSQGFQLLWESSRVEDTEVVAFADYDGDGRLDLSVGNWWQPARIYKNDGAEFTSIWSYDVAADNGNGTQIESLAWTDYDGDGDPDLFIGRHDLENVLLRNDGGSSLFEVWRSTNRAPTRVAAWHSWRRPDGFAPLCSW